MLNFYIYKCKLREKLKCDFCDIFNKDIKYFFYCINVKSVWYIWILFLILLLNWNMLLLVWIKFESIIIFYLVFKIY